MPRAIPPLLSTSTGAAGATAIPPATDPDSIERTSAGFLRKYASDPAAKAMVGPDVLETTLRLEPA